MLPRADSSNASGRSGGVAGPPFLALPKGGGAVRGIGEKFAANPVTGTGSLTIPVATSPGRSGFGPQLALSYDSGSGNGPFGLGWDLSLPAITRKTDKGLPRYFDAQESDVFLLSGSEDLVPELTSDGSRYEDSTRAPGYTIHRYRPRIEGLFARIERWTKLDPETGQPAEPPDVHWRSISKDNILTLYGPGANSRIQDPDDPGRVFSWLISETRDDKGNAVLYEYKAENGTGVDLTKACERNRGGSGDPRRHTNRYLKRICYGNRKPLLDAAGKRPRFLTRAEIENRDKDAWMFEVVFDYGEHDESAPTPSDAGDWTYRHDPFSTYRAGFEVRTCRLCQRVLMFHNFPDETGVGHFPDETGVGADCLVRSTDFTYRYEHEQAQGDPRNPIHSVLTSVTQCGYRRKPGGYLKRSLPPVEFDYSAAVFDDTVRELDSKSVENLPYGLDGSTYQWADLDGDGLAGVLTEQGGAWLYKRNESPLTRTVTDGIARTAARLGPVETIPSRPGGGLAGGSRQLLDLAGDGQLDLVELSPPIAGFYERTDDGDWQPFRPFTDNPNLDWQDPNLKLVDLTGDGHADVLITEDEVFTWYPSLAEAGFGSAERLPAAFDEEHGPRVVFADGSQTLFLADLSGDGLTDIVVIRNGEVCYWPNLGYGRFGAKVTMDDAPWFDAPDQFDPRRIRLADIDGSGVTDILYLGRRETRVWLNQSGNAWGAPQTLAGFPDVDNVASVVAVDLLGNGTGCLVWSSPLPGESRAALRYLDLMAQGKPHLMVGLKNNLGAETRVRYVASTSFYLTDRQAGHPWITRLPFPVHVVERVETHDHISGNRFTTRYAYHHGFFDGVEREFRGFGMVEQWDTEELAALTADGTLPAATNEDPASHVPPVLTRTWFHTGVYLGREHVSDFFAGLLDGNDKGEYYREPGLTDDEASKLHLDDVERRLYDDKQARARLLPDTVLPPGHSVDEAREACRAIKGSMLRQEVYALDGGDKEQTPYSVTEQNFTVRLIQGRKDNRHAVFFTHARETLGYRYERDPEDPRISHALTLHVDDYGNVLEALAIGYGRRKASTDPSLTAADKAKQTGPLITFTENSVTNPIDDSVETTDGKTIKYPDDHRAPLPAETRTYELTGFKLESKAVRFSMDDWTTKDPITGLLRLESAAEIDYEVTASPGDRQKRLIEHVRTRYREDDLTGLLPLGKLEPLALPGESYTLAFTPGLLHQVYTPRRPGQPDEPLLPTDPVQLTQLLGGKGADQGGYIQIDGNWWIPAGRVHYSTDPKHSAAQELAEAQAHFYLPRRYRDPFDQDTLVDFDGPAVPSKLAYDLLATRTQDALGNTVEAANDYRVLQPSLVTDANGNQTAAAFDALGLVVATATMGKSGEGLGDLLQGFDPDPTLAELQQFVADPLGEAASLLGKATNRIVYDLERFTRARDPDHPECGSQPPFAATLARETHLHEPGGAQTKIQVGFSYSDGFGREIQKKIQAEPGEAPQRGNPVVMASGDTCPGKLKRDAKGEPEQGRADPRWVGTGRTVFNNKGKPVRKYEPFFSAAHLYEPERDMTDTGVSPVLFYDPLDRVIATLHPNHTYEKVGFDPWRQTTYDVNDTVAASGQQTADPRTDPDIASFVEAYFKTQPAAWQTWHQERTTGQMGNAEQEAAQKAAKHADTPTIAHFDVLGRPFLTLADNGPDPAKPTERLLFATRVELDIEGNQRAVIDAKDRIVMRYDYDIAGPEQREDGEEDQGPDSIHHASMEAGERWLLKDVASNPIRAWDSRGHALRTEYDTLRRPVARYVRGTDAQHSDPRTLNKEPRFEEIDYGEGQANAAALNLRTRVYRHCDGAGAVTYGYDFKGNLLASTRELADEYKDILDWGLPQPPGETFKSSTAYDALNRPIALRTPDQSDSRLTYNEANLLQAIRVNLRGEQQNGQPVWTDFVINIDYDAKGQRTRIDYGNKVTTRYEYDPLTYRLTHLLTRRDPSFLDDCPQQPKAGWPGCQVQNLHYTYDPAGNITRIRDDAQQTIFFANQRVEPTANYSYDAIYRLTEATGREHLGQAANGSPLPPTPSSHTDSPRLLHPSDGNAMGRYRQQYVYDEVGNFLKMIHQGTNPANPGWTRQYTYQEDSLLDPGKKSNRLSSTRIGTGATEKYTHDDHGNMTSMPHLSEMRWDFEDQLLTSARQVVNQGAPKTTYYVYDAGGQRVRKVTERQNGTHKTERIYLGGYESYRDYSGDGSTVTLERETLHIMDDKQRIALVETRTDVANSPAEQLIRYQLGNHIGSASLELDGDSKIISFEEYYSFGSTAYQAVRDQTETPKRYRYTGKERDEETELGYHRARYYASWIGRWISVDPDGLMDGSDFFVYSRNNPIRISDPSGRQSYRNDPRGNLYRGIAFVKSLPRSIAESFWDLITQNPAYQTCANVTDIAMMASGAVLGKDLSKHLTGNIGRGAAAGASDTDQAVEVAKQTLEVGVSKGFDIGLKHLTSAAPQKGLRLLKGKTEAPPRSSPSLANKAPAETARDAETMLQHEFEFKFAYVEGQTTRAATVAEAKIFRESVHLKREISVSTVSGVEHTIEGEAASVAVYAGKNVTDVLHTHPVTRVARASIGKESDIGAIQAGNYPQSGTFRIVAERWPITRQTAKKIGAMPPPTRIVTTVIPVSSVYMGHLRYQSFRIP
ncbi:SpvB/TcaC N-terminal domain-containing protein [Thiocapsa bogorovii]|uniref:SpvB/TcaC N-terminal domain-containing protein n=1 Tax=Thiocapsa bogorovii TaxID=521689 RepID=UPI001E330FCE|nr:SpvB/TcaC N-terminal domain-containing protein [Thiocapsa bogorovii]UHD15035.1 toxin [Thiocapsa bogorovii]